MKTYLILSLFLLGGLFAIAQENNCACCTEDHKGFDFWLGSWKVTGPDGKPLGTNTISKSGNQCVVYENWTSASPGFTGASTNFFNKKTEEWEQLWVDSTGSHLKLKGKRVGNKMILSSEAFENDKGMMTRHRITWTANKDGTVRQLWEVLQGDKVVNVAFDGQYRKME